MESNAGKQSGYTIVGIGEILWDMLPTGKQLGGAPTNFAYHCHVLGDDAVVASRLGNDPLGQEIRDRLGQLQLDDRYLQTDGDHATGTVEVEVSSAGEPTYDIKYPAAWDYSEWTEQWQELAARADAVCFGSLAQRSAASRAAIGDFLQTTRASALRVFDINLRQSFYTTEVLDESLRMSRMVKLNDEELPRVAQLLDLGADGVEKTARKMIAVYDLELLCLTRGSQGCMLITAGETAEHAGFAAEVADTVGSGDAFTAALVHHCLRKTPLSVIAEAANRLGAWVAAKPGGTPPPDDEIMRRIRSGKPKEGS